jgi:hypothetical protein
MAANAAPVLNAISAKAEVVVSPVFLTSNPKALHYRIGNVAPCFKAKDSSHGDLCNSHPRTMSISQFAVC